MLLVGYFYSKWFTETQGDIKYLLYAGGWTFIMGLLGFIYLRGMLKFKIYRTNLSMSKNYDLIMDIVSELNWNQKKIRKHKIIVSDRRYDIPIGQIITIIPEENYINFNCTHTNSKFSDLSTRIHISNDFKTKLFERINKDL
ncbi:MAG: hypothetical protein AB7S69_08625 [Salinivirgaceae bacterium]